MRKATRAQIEGVECILKYTYFFSKGCMLIFMLMPLKQAKVKRSRKIIIIKKNTAKLFPAFQH